MIHKNRSPECSAADLFHYLILIYSRLHGSNPQMGYWRHNSEINFTNLISARARARSALLHRSNNQISTSSSRHIESRTTKKIKNPFNRTEIQRKKGPQHNRSQEHDKLTWRNRSGSSKSESPSSPSTASWISSSVWKRAAISASSNGSDRGSPGSPLDREMEADRRFQMQSSDRLPLWRASGEGWRSVSCCCSFPFFFALFYLIFDLSLLLLTAIASNWMEWQQFKTEHWGRRNIYRWRGKRTKLNHWMWSS